MDRICPTQPTSCTFAQYSQQASSSTNNIQGSVYVRIMVFTRQIQNRITFSLVAATDNLLGCWMHYARFGGPQSRERRIESKMIWAQYPDCSKPFCCSRPQKEGCIGRWGRWRWWGGGRQHPAGGSSGRSKRGERKRASERAAESLQPHVDVTTKARPDPAALVSPFRCWCFLANDCDRLGGLPMPSSPSYGQLERAQLETATESNTSAGVVFFFLSSSFPLAPFRGYSPCLIPERIQELASLALFSCPNPYSAPWLETNKKTQRNGGLQPTAIL